ncbi:aspartate/glutamate racemase family protein [Desulfosarcina ovata]|uniref:Aspartate racemase n=1 Tax=Desulfosarcina ovata subsp. ovata TaxID=2752305 RepID=A0A5K8ADY0_9BACT|nr:aspartate/glutamate racemase family protein [Desulfosarcina ovata]BBO90746.1 aspartate racemase [Desulfosarcina ovata subsp. ovata]
MKTIGLLGGMSWESTLTYYRAVNEGVKNRLGGLHSAKIVLYSVDFDPIERLQHQGDWDGTADILSDAARCIEAGGADFMLICTNTMHKVADRVAAAVNIPLLHIADATGEALRNAGIQRVGLLGTAFTMEQDFYKGRLMKKYGLDVLIPDENDRLQVHDVIYQELCLGVIKPESRQAYVGVVDRLAQNGAEAVILGCTEIGLLINQADTPVPLYDTTVIHAGKAVELAFS